MSDEGPQNDNRKPVKHKQLLAAIAKARSGLGMKQREPGKRTPVAEYFFGYDWFHTARKWIYKEWILNKRGDHYREVITDPETGEVIHHRDEPLSKHQGYGSAKRKK